MSFLADDIGSARVPEGAVRLWWLGQAGFAFKSAAGKVIYLDPYLSDAVERLHGFKRLSLAPISADEVRVDTVLLTHEHADHLDPDAIPVISANNPACRFAAPAGCLDGLKAADVSPNRITVLEPRTSVQIGSVTVHTAAADHGDHSITALSYLLDFDGARIFGSGDTSWRPGLFQPLFDLKPDVVLPCINGVYGNMNHIDAAMLVQQAAPRIAIPCHFWTFAEQGGGDPGGFVHACKHFAPEAKAVLLRPGEGLTLEHA